MLIEPRGTRRLSSQTLLDFRVSQSVPLRRRWDESNCCLDVLNVLNDTAEESIRTDAVRRRQRLGQPDIFIDPRRAMLSVRLNLGR